MKLGKQEARILCRFDASPNILLYGPPGTGKTRAMIQLQKFLQDEYPDDGSEPFNPTEDRWPFEVDFPPLPGEIRTEWLTFHQSTEYEDFVMGMRPEPQDGAVELQPYAGALLSLIDHVRGGNTGIIFIDEINRANVSKVFGEFISVMEENKRSHSDGSLGEETIGLTLPQLSHDQEIRDPITGESIEIERPYTVPRHLYVVASMNSLDRSTAPLDSALARRFEQISFSPDYEVLCDAFDISGDSPEDWLENSPAETEVEEIAIALLHRINYLLSGSLGQDFQLGHGYLNRLFPEGLTEHDRLRELGEAWEGRLFPKLRELYRGRDEQLATILRVDSEEGPYYRDETYGTELDEMAFDPPLVTPPLTEWDDDELRGALWFLAGGDSE